MKPCKKCGETKPLTEFYTNKGNRDGYQGSCKRCVYLTCKAYRDRNDAAIRSKKRRAHKLSRYNLTQESFEGLVAQQDGCCAICHLPLVPGRETHIDHDHMTGAVRGVLCVKCNFAIGALCDNPDNCRSAASYLERNGRRSLRLA